MGSFVEINDTLQITVEQGFPVDILERGAHVRSPVTAEMLKDRVFEFHGKPGARLFQLAPVRVYLVHNIGGKWLFWGKIAVIQQSISRVDPGDASTAAPQWQTSGRFIVLEVYDPDYQEVFTRRESPTGLSYF